MKIAITGGTGFVGRHLARELVTQGYQVVLIARGVDTRDDSVTRLPGVAVVKAGVSDAAALATAFAGCDGVAHCAGINREIGAQTYQAVHIDGTRNVVEAARQAGVPKVLLLSFLRARPACGQPYHESKWAAEEIVRGSGLDYTILKAGVIYGSGDHMLDHLSHAFHTFPIFALVGMKEKPVRPVAVADMTRIIAAALTQGRLSRQTVAVTGPEEMDLGEAVRRVARVCGRRPLMFRAPLWFHYALGWVTEKVMTVPLVALAQVRILSEGVVEPLPFAERLPDDLMPRTPFSDSSIRAGLPVAERFGLKDLRCHTLCCVRGQG
jgi:NADH dehydrogenase